MNTYVFIQIPVFLENGLNNPEYLNARNDYFLVTWGERNEFIGGMPVTLENKCFRQLIRTDQSNRFSYNLTLKVDGERCIMFLSSWGEIYFIDRLLNFFIFINSSNNERLPRINIKPCLIDGELVSFSKYDIFEFLIFDLIIYDSQDYSTKDYYTRYDVAKFALNNVFDGYLKSIQSNIRISLKEWFPITDIVKTKDIYAYIIKETNSSRKLKIEADGLILQPFDTEYVKYGPWNNYGNIQFKWKPLDHQTIDFKIKVVLNRWELLTKHGYPFTIPNTGKVATYKPTKNESTFVDGDVIEFTYSKDSGFKIFRKRTNKEANSLNSALSVWNFINDPFTLDVLKEPLRSLTSGSGDIKDVLGLLSKSDLILIILKDKLFFTKKEYKGIKNVYSTFDPSTDEMEFRLFQHGKRSLTADKFSFLYLKEFLLKNFEVLNKTTIDIAEHKDSFEEPTYRSSYSSFEDIPRQKVLINDKKTPKSSFTSSELNKKLYNNLSFKFANSKEEITNKVVSLKKITRENPRGFNNTIRIKNRYSFKLGELWNMDLTIVKMGYSMENAMNANETYEIECEYISKTKVPFQHFIKSFSNNIIFILSNINYC
jgi:hypothetical protein